MWFKLLTVMMVAVVIILLACLVVQGSQVSRVKEIGAYERLKAYSYYEYSVYLQYELVERNVGMGSNAGEFETPESFFANYLWPNGETDEDRLAIVYSELWGE